MSKMVPCHYERCKYRRAHFEHPEIQRGVQLIEVPDGFAGQAFCSLTCKMMHDGYQKIKEASPCAS